MVCVMLLVLTLAGQDVLGRLIGLGQRYSLRSVWLSQAHIGALVPETQYGKDAYKVTAASKLKAAGLESPQVQNEKGSLEQLLTETQFTFDMYPLPGETC